MANSGTETLYVEVVYAIPGDTTVIPVVVEIGATIAAAIRMSGIERLFPEIDPESSKVGVFSQLRSPHDPVSNGDRIEIYRPLIADPKEIRRKRATGLNNS